MKSNLPQIICPPDPQLGFGKNVEKEGNGVKLNRNMNVRIMEKGGIKVKSLLIDKKTL